MLLWFLESVVMDTAAADAIPPVPPSSAMTSISEMPVSPASVVSSTHFPFSASEMSGMGMDTSALDTTFTSDVATSVGLQLVQDAGPGNSRDSLRSIDQIQWTFSLSDLTEDLSNLGGIPCFTVGHNLCVFLCFEPLLCYYSRRAYRTSIRQIRSLKF